MTEFTEEKVVFCPLCDFVTTTKNILNIHAHQRHKKDFIATKLNEKKKTWIQALEQAIQRELDLPTEDWPDLTRAWDKSLRDVGIRVPIQTLREITPWNLDERIVNKPDHLDELWNAALRYAKSEEETTQQTDWEKYINEEFTREVNRAARQNDQLNFENAELNLGIYFKNQLDNQLRYPAPWTNYGYLKLKVYNEV